MKRSIAYLVIFCTSTLVLLFPLSFTSHPQQTLSSTSWQDNHPATPFMYEDQGLWYSGSSSDHRVAAPAGVGEPALQKATFTINYAAGVHPFFNEYCEPWPAQAQAAFVYATTIWGTLIDSPVPIVIEACWAQMDHPSVLGSSAAGDYFQNFTGAIRADTWYHVALANALAGKDLDPDAPDMYIVYNNAWHTDGKFYYGTDTNPGEEQIDFSSVVLHEIAHGLGFSGSMYVSGDSGSWGGGQPNSKPFIFEVFAQDGQGQRLTNTSVFPNPSQQLAQVLTSDDLFFNGLHANSANGGSFPKLYAPSDWRQGSSFSHLDDSYDDTEHALMTWAIHAGEAIHHPGSITLGILKDIGWTTVSETPPQEDPVVSVAPITAAAGTTFTYNGSHFIADETITLWLTDSAETRIDLPEARADSQGEFLGTWESTTTSPTGKYTLVAEGSKSQQQVSVEFTLTEGIPEPGMPTLKVDPTSGSIGTLFVYTGSDFIPGEQVSCWLIDSENTRYNGPTLTADKEGDISGGWQIEAGDPNGTYVSYAAGEQSKHTASASFTVLVDTATPVSPTISISPVMARPGTTIVYTGEHFTPGEQVTLKIVNQQDKMVEQPTLIADNEGRFEESLTIYENSTLGTYTIYALGEQSQQQTSMSFAVIPETDTSQRINYAGTYSNASAGVFGEFSIDMVIEVDKVSGFIDFTNRIGQLPFCGAGEFIGTRNNNELVWQFVSQDDDQGCGFDVGWLFRIEAELFDDNTSILGTYQVQEQTGLFQARRTYAIQDPDTKTSSSVVVRTDSDGIAYVTLTAGTTPAVATVMGKTETLMSMTTVAFGTDDTTVAPTQSIYLPIVLRPTMSFSQQSTRITNTNTLAIGRQSEQPNGTSHPMTINPISQPSVMVLDVEDEHIPADGKSATTIIVLVLDTMGNPVRDEIVQVETTAGTLSAKFAANTDEVAPDSVVITGPATGYTDSYQQFQATISPATIADSISYYWTPEPKVGQGKATVYYRWDTPGEKTIFVEAFNSAGIVLNSTVISITAEPEDEPELVPPSAVTITGPRVMEINTTFMLTATVDSPEDVTLPLTYTWLMDTYWEQRHVTQATQDQLSLAFDKTGDHSFVVLVENSAGSVTSEQFTLTIQDTSPISPFVKNGSFEDDDDHWFQLSANNLRLILNQDVHNVPVTPRTGDGLVWLGGAQDEVSQIWQEIRLPQEPTALSLYFWLATSETTCDGTGDMFEFLVDGRVRGEMELCEYTATNGWSRMGGTAFDLSNYAGQTISVLFRVTTDDVTGTNSNFFLDDIEVYPLTTDTQGSSDLAPQ